MKTLIELIEKIYPGVHVAIEDQEEFEFKFNHPEYSLDVYVGKSEFSYTSVNDERVFYTLSINIPGAWKIIDQDQLEVAYRVCNEFNENTSILKSSIYDERRITVGCNTILTPETAELCLTDTVEFCIAGWIELNSLMDKSLFVERE